VRKRLLLELELDQALEPLLRGVSGGAEVSALPMERCRHSQGPFTDVFAALTNATHCGHKGCKAPTESYWLCLHCGFAACGRSDSQHALQHFKSSSHPVSIHVRSAQIWCYVCDAEVGCDDDIEAADASVVGAVRDVVIRHRQKSVKRAGERSTPLPADASSAQSAAGVSHALSHRMAASATTVTYAAKAGLTGLQNLGNTCFLDAALQALSHVPPLALNLTECSFAARQAKEGTLAMTLKSLLQDLWITAHPVGGSGAQKAPFVAPSALLRALRRANPIFEVREVTTGAGVLGAHFLCAHRHLFVL
jgi:ubiquitin carboxyl-terminal hydrolase 20/33